MGDNSLADHLGRLCVLTDAERAAVNAVAGGDRLYRRGTIIRSERDTAGEMFVVKRGWLFCSTLLEDGRRQIIRLHLPGDLLGADSLVFAEATDAICALTDAEVTLIDKPRFGRMLAEHPRLAAILIGAMQVDRVMLTDRLASLGRSSARGRVAALLLWIADRLRGVGPDDAASFTLPMTQEEIGDATGLTAVHVNRTMRLLAEQGLIGRSGNMIRILDTDRLARIANHVERPLRVDLQWLPDAR